MINFLSIIVPIYNVEKYLSRCLDSLLDQGLDSDHCEIILINDGSKDSSLEICKKYQNQNKIFILISQENKGLPTTRNVGIQQAKGDYLCFIDSDDFLVSNGLSHIVSKTKELDFDILRFYTKLVKEEEKDCTSKIEGTVDFIGTGFDYIKKNGLETFCWNYIYKKEFIKKNNLAFKELPYAEDFGFMSDVFFCNPIICSTSYSIHRYVVHQNSITTTRTYSHLRNCIEAQIAVNNDIIARMDSKGIKVTDPLLYDKCMKSIQGKLPLIFSRILCTNYSKQEYEAIISSLKNTGQLPAKPLTNSVKSYFIANTINLISTNPALISICSYFYKTIFINYIYPRLNRNNNTL